MADRSTIEWTKATWNPTTGCDRTSPGGAASVGPDTGELAPFPTPAEGRRAHATTTCAIGLSRAPVQRVRSFKCPLARRPNEEHHGCAEGASPSRP
jgi:hypothetical protein